MREMGFNLLKTVDFPDHHQYTQQELENLIAMAEKQRAELYTTSKDFVKIPAKLQKNFKVLEIGIQWENKAELTDFLKKHI